MAVLTQAPRGKPPGRSVQYFLVQLIGTSESPSLAAGAPPRLRVAAKSRVVSNGWRRFPRHGASAALKPADSAFRAAKHSKSGGEPWEYHRGSLRARRGHFSLLDAAPCFNNWILAAALIHVNRAVRRELRRNGVRSAVHFIRNHRANQRPIAPVTLKAEPEGQGNKARSDGRCHSARVPRESQRCGHTATPTCLLPKED